MKLPIVFSAILAAALALDDVAVTNFKIGVLAKDQQPSDENLKSLPIFSKLPNQLKADASQRLYISFGLNKKADNAAAIKPQQVFLRFEAPNGEDVVVSVNPDAANSGGYLYDTVLRTAAKSFRNLSGQFKISLLVGGATLKNPINWYLADIDATLPTVYNPTPKSQQVHYKPLKEIRHMFREPEKRPSAVISDAFTLICLSPIVVLIGLWSQVGINFDNVPASPWVPVFHAGLAAILGLYVCFWIQLDMFETLKYLALLGFLTFVAGNRVLRALAAGKAKTE